MTVSQSSSNARMELRFPTPQPEESWPTFMRRWLAIARSGQSQTRSSATDARPARLGMAGGAPRER
jgi:hypothetical protein